MTNSAIEADLLDPQVMRNAIFAALHVLVGQEESDIDHKDYVLLLEKLYIRGRHHHDAEVVKQAHIASVTSALFQRPGPASHPVSRAQYQELRSRLENARDLVGTRFELPKVVRMLAQQMLARLPEAMGLYSAAVLSGIANAKLLDGDFTRYRRLLDPIELFPAPRLDVLQATLTSEFPWMDRVTEDIIGQLRLSHECGRRYFHLLPILLVGDPGVGKTRYWRRIAAQTRVPFRVLSAAGASDSMSLRGTSRGWSTARPSTLVQMFLTHLCANPIALIDEIEKSGTSRRNGNFLDVLLSLLEKESSRNWFDEGLDMGSVDMSYITFIATANQLGPIPKALLDRFSIHLVRAPGKEHYPVIIDSILGDIAVEYGLADSRLLPQIGHSEREELVRQCDNVRQLARAVRTILQRNAADCRRPQMEN